MREQSADEMMVLLIEGLCQSVNELAEVGRELASVDKSTADGRNPSGEDAESVGSLQITPEDDVLIWIPPWT